MKWLTLAAIIAVIAIGVPVLADEAPAATAADPAATTSALTAASEALQKNINIVWTCMAAFLVFFMQAGFAMVETGFTRAKNTVNILMKNLMDFAIGTPVYFLVGFGLMFGVTNGLFGTTMFGLKGVVGSDWQFTFMIFQTVFAATSATIVSGAMAERTKFSAYLIYSFMISLFIYPIFGHWAWGGGWLSQMGFCDFAGSTVVHSIGGWLALAGAFILGPRIGKYGPDGKAKAIPGHNIPLAALGVFILWFGWFGFNPGSTVSGDGSIGRIAVTTNLAGAMGAIASLILTWIMTGKPDGSMTLNGALAGLVAVTAGCATVTPMGAMWIGVLAGLIVVLAVNFFDRIVKIDDPVGAISVHGVCGAFGTLACGLFNAQKAIGIGDVDTGLFYGGGFHQLYVQFVGVATAMGWALVLGIILFVTLKKTVGLRVTAEEEQKGLDIGEHGMEGYSGFQIFNG